MDALSLSHLTYCCATITVNFHRLDHPPFPCKSRLLPSEVAGKYQLEDRRRYIRACPTGIRRQIALTYLLLGKAPDLMKAATIVGILLIVLGIIGFATGGLSFTHQKKDVDVGPVQISHKTQDTIPLSPIFSTVSLVAGLALVVVGARSK
jgi:hypothetical protein